ncbi:MAG: hypothetical protein ACF8PN_02625 [Phycisphaerales bacterium]
MAITLYDSDDIDAVPTGRKTHICETTAVLELLPELRAELSINVWICNPNWTPHLSFPLSGHVQKPLSFNGLISARFIFSEKVGSFPVLCQHLDRIKNEATGEIVTWSNYNQVWRKIVANIRKRTPLVSLWQSESGEYVPSAYRMSAGYAAAVRQQSIRSRFRPEE